MTMPMYELQILNGIFDVDDTTGTELGVHRAALDELFELLPAQVEGGSEIPRCSAIDIPVPMSFDLFSEREVARNMAELDHGLPFKRRGQSMLAVIRGDFVQRIGEKTFAAVGTQADVEMKDAFLSGLHPLEQFLREPFEVFTVLDASLALCAAGAAVDEQDLDVRRISQLAAAELSRTHDGKGTRLAVRQSGGTVDLVELRLAVSQAAFNDHFGQLSQGEGEVGEARVGLDDVLHV